MFTKIFNLQRQLLVRPVFRFYSYRKPDTDILKAAKKSERADKHVWAMNLGVLFTIFGLVYMSVPLYRKFCSSVGITGNTDKKDYSVMKSTTSKSNKSRKFKIIFEGEADPEMNWEFEPEQKELMVNSGETALMFYRAYNSQPKPVIGVATYTVVPEYAAQYFAKIQCFCFNQQLINSKEELLLPLYFYFEPEIEEDHNLENVNTIRVHYRFFFNKSQELADMVQNQKVIDLNNKIKILEKRKTRNDEGSSEWLKAEKEMALSKIELANIYIEDKSINYN